MEKVNEDTVTFKETTEESALDTVLKICDLQGVERLVIETHGDDARTYIPFGAEGLSVIISLYGGVLRMSNIIADSTSRILCLASSKLRYYDHDLVRAGSKLDDLAKLPEAGFKLRIFPEPEGGFPTVEPKLCWLNGRWPCISYEIDGILVVSTFVIKHGVTGGVLSQQFKIFNTTPQAKSIRYALQFVGASVLTLSSDGQTWRGPDPLNIWSNSNPPPQRRGLCLSLDENEYDKTKTYHFRGSAIIAIFQNGKVYESPDSILCAEKTDDDEENRNQENAFAQMTLPSSSLETLTVQYRLQPLDSEDPCCLEYFDSDALLRSEIPANWVFKDKDPFNPILRRQLEYVLGLCPAVHKPRAGEKYRVPFINDITFESFSNPTCDLFIFRFLLMMYRLLASETHVCSTILPDQLNPDQKVFERADLLASIEEVCTGHLRWCFDGENLVARQSWPYIKTEADEHIPTTSPNPKPFTGSLHMMKLFEYAAIFETKMDFVRDCLLGTYKIWLKALSNGRDEKSRLWFQDTKKAYIVWDGHRDEGSGWLELPDYRLGDLIYLWKALKSLKHFAAILQDNEVSPAIAKELKDSALDPAHVRGLILERFMYQPKDAVAVPHSRQDGGTFGSGSSNPFAIAVRKSRDRSRLLFYAKDTMLYDGLEWGFFDNNLHIELLSNLNESHKVNIMSSWQNTVQSQGMDQELIWNKPLRYALAILMAMHRQSMDQSMNVVEAGKCSWERLSRCVTIHGLFAYKINRDTKLAKYLNLSETPRSLWEIPTILLRARYRELEFHSGLESVRSQGTGESVDHAQDPQTLPTSPQRDPSSNTRAALQKKVALAKSRSQFTEKIDLTQVFDPIERRLEDWLYPLPSIFNREEAYSSMQSEIDNFDANLDRDVANPLGNNARNLAHALLKRGCDKWKEEERFSAYTWRTIIVDIAEHKSFQPEIYSKDAEDLDKVLRVPRRPGVAKKRFCYIGHLQIEHALLFYLATPPPDRQSMARFYIRHSSFEASLQEDAHPLADVWSTELHLGFLQLVQIDGPSSDELNYDGYAGAQEDDVCNGRQRKFPYSIKGAQFNIYKASLSYRLTGDMGDKFWSGYLMLYLPGSSKILPPGGSDTAYEEVEKWFQSDTKNDQRRILEPYLVEKMTSELFQSTHGILKPIEDWLDPDMDVSKDQTVTKDLTSSKVDDKDFDVQYSRSAMCLELEATLRVLQRLTKANVTVLDQWSKRESTRHYKPRWSEKDELKFRKLVDHQKRRAERGISAVKEQLHQIQTSIDQVRNHRQELVNNLGLAESRNAAHESENIRIFTYATVIFYPLSFVASLFSMQGPPNHTVTPLFIQATAIALVVTMAVVFNAETLAWPIRRLRFSISHNARAKMENTSNIFPVKWTETIVRIKEAEELDILHVNEMPKRPRSKLIYLVFLVIYTLIDFPAARIAIAYESIARIDVFSVDRVILIVGRFAVAILLLPIFIPVWLLLAVWNLLFWVGQKIFDLPIRNWHELQKASDQKELEQLVEKHEANRPAEPEAAKDSEKEKGGNRRRSMGGAPVQDGGAAAEPKKKQERFPKDLAEEDRRNARKEKEERMKQHVALLVNPPKLYKHLRRKDSSGGRGAWYTSSTSAVATSPAKEHRYRGFASGLFQRLVHHEEPKVEEKV